MTEKDSDKKLREILSSRNISYAGEDEMKIVNSKLKPKFKYLNLQGPFLNYSFDENKNGCHVAMVHPPEVGPIYPPKHQVNIGDEIIAIKKTTYNNALKDFDKGCAEDLFDKKLNDIDDNSDFFNLENLPSFSIYKFLGKLKIDKNLKYRDLPVYAHVTLKYKREKKNETAIYKILVSTCYWERYCAYRAQGGKELGDKEKSTNEFILSHFEGYPDFKHWWNNK